MARKRPNRPRLVPVSELLRSHAAIADCLERQRREGGLLTRVRDLLGPHARPHCLEARAAQGILTLTVDSPAWATRLRYQAPDLLAGLGGLGLSELRIRTRPQSPDPQPRHPTALAPSRLAPAVVQHLLAAADGCAVPAIGEIFRRLAHRAGAGAGASGGARGDIEV